MPVSITVRVDPSVNDRIREWLARHDMSMSDFVREAIEEKLARGKPMQSAYDLAVEMNLVGSYRGRPIGSERAERKKLLMEALGAKHRR